MGRAVWGAVAPLRGDSGLIRIKGGPDVQRGHSRFWRSMQVLGGRYLSIWSYSCKCLKSSSAPAGSLSFVSTVWHYTTRAVPDLVIFLEILEGWNLKKKKKSLHQSTCPWLVFSFGKILFPSRASSEIHLHFNSAVCCPCHGPAFWVLLRVAGAFSFFPIPGHPVNLHWIMMSPIGRMWGWHFFAKSYFYT